MPWKQFWDNSREILSAKKELRQGKSDQAAGHLGFLTPTWGGASLDDYRWIFENSKTPTGWWPFHEVATLSVAVSGTQGNPAYGFSSDGSPQKRDTWRVHAVPCWLELDDGGDPAVVIWDL